jgi:hypothetical protein
VHPPSAVERRAPTQVHEAPRAVHPPSAVEHRAPTQVHAPPAASHAAPAHPAARKEQKKEDNK